MNEKFISIILPNYNGGKYLNEAILSFVNQPYPYKELIVVDGKSSDESHQILEAWTNKNRAIKWLKIKDRGISDAVNIGIANSEGNIIGYLGADDVLMEGIFEKIIKINRYVDFDYIYCNSYTYYIKERKCFLQKPIIESFDFKDLLHNGTIVGLQNIFFNRNVFEYLSFNIENKFSMDYELLLELTAKNSLGVYLDEVATLNFFDGNISHNNINQTAEAAQVAFNFAKRYSYKTNLSLFREDLIVENKISVRNFFKLVVRYFKRLKIKD